MGNLFGLKILKVLFRSGITRDLG